MESHVVGDDRSYHLFEHGLLVFERALASSGSHRLFVSRASVCPEPDCDCRDATLAGVGLDVATGAKDFDPQQLGAMLEGSQAMHARLHIDLGLVEPDDHDGRLPLTQEWVDYLQSQVDGDLLDKLHDMWLRAKGLRPKALDDVMWPPIQPGELVGWYEVHPGDRRDSYLLDDAIFIAEDFYCATPACACLEVTIDFTELAGAKQAASVGRIQVQLPGLQVTEWKHKRDRALLEKLWSAFQARHRRLGERLTNRKRHIADLAAARRRTPVVAASHRVGRNEPCPCGSGKKYKRCCAP